MASVMDSVNYVPTTQRANDCWTVYEWSRTSRHSFCYFFTKWNLYHIVKKSFERTFFPCSKQHPQFSPQLAKTRQDERALWRPLFRFLGNEMRRCRLFCSKAASNLQEKVRGLRGNSAWLCEATLHGSIWSRSVGKADLELLPEHALGWSERRGKQNSKTQVKKMLPCFQKLLPCQSWKQA